MDICLIGASPVSDNRGVAALATGAITAALRASKDNRVFLLDYEKARNSHVIRYEGGTTDVELVNIRFSKKIWLRNNIGLLLLAAMVYRTIPSRSLRRWIAKRFPVIERLLEVDFVGSIAGGDSFSDIYGLIRLIYVSLPMGLVLILGKPLILLPQTLGPFRGWLGKRIARCILKRASAIYSRDTLSLEETRQLVPRGDINVCPDLAFAMDAFCPGGEALARIEARKGSRPLIGLNVSGLLLMGGYTQNNMFGLKGDYRELIHAIIDYFTAREADIVLISHVFGADGESDNLACDQIFGELKRSTTDRVHVLPGTYATQEIKYIIGRCDFFLGSRMHACIAGLSQFVPCIGLAYSRKFLGVFDSIGVGDLVVDPCQLTNAEVIARIDEIFKGREELRQRLQRSIPEVKERISALFRRLADDESDMVKGNDDLARENALV